MLLLSLLLPVYSVPNSRTLEGYFYLGVGPSISANSLSQTWPEVCLLGDSRIDPVNINDSNNKIIDPGKY